jgi:hypothetical protein
MEQLIGELDLDEKIAINNLGYFPIPDYGAYNLALQSGASWRFAYLPDTEKNLPTDAYDGIIILSDTYEGASAWIEQLSSLLPSIPVNLIVTAQAGPMLLPYVSSGQVVGMIAGISEAIGIESDLAQNNDIEQRWQAYQVGVLLLIVLLVFGAILPIGRINPIERQKEQ